MPAGPRDETAIRVAAFRSKVLEEGAMRPTMIPIEVAPPLDHRMALVRIEARLARVEAMLERMINPPEA
jgi:hypothetical protein